MGLCCSRRQTNQPKAKGEDLDEELQEQDEPTSPLKTQAHTPTWLHTWQTLATQQMPGENIETMIFLDVDGVLNFAVADETNNPIAFTDHNIKMAFGLESRNEKDVVADRLLSAYRKDIGQEDPGTYGKYASRPDVNLCDVFIQRLVQLIQAVDVENCLVVLSSSWRLPSHAEKVARLEDLISGQLGMKFKFGGRTVAARETRGQERLTLIGDYIADYCKTNGTLHARALVLDDFMMSPVRGWACNCKQIDSIKAAESYLQSCAPASAKIIARVIHTFDEWTDGVLQMRVGSGLSYRHIWDALSFLETPAVAC
jgi:hypothetical protein